MSVTVDYLVVYSEELDLMELLTETLKNELEGVDDEPLEEEELKQYINIRYTKRREDETQRREDRRRISGFSVEFDTAEEWMGDLIDNFSESVADCTDEGIEHLLKLNDPQLQRTLRDYGEEIFEIEMKLREALSLIFVDTYGQDFYTLLKDVNITQAEHPSVKRMQQFYENEFFFLFFSHYPRINDRKRPNQDGIFEYIQQAEDFEELKQRMTTNPITKERYVAFLASLRQQVDSIEKLRNCVAHNRSIPKRTLDNYKTAKDLLLEEINEFLEEQASDDNATGD